MPTLAAAVENFAEDLQTWKSKAGPLAPPATNGVTPKILFACVATTPSDPGSPWTGRIMVPQYAAKGTWRITRVRVQDRAQNIRDYTQADPIIANAIFTVQ